ncbi:MAG: hypothetical protein SGJ11_17995 [Phycisphaerae bacterium]|nr:hypothetical protein [Phycisphaerae bacterium]
MKRAAWVGRGVRLVTFACCTTLCACETTVETSDGRRMPPPPHAGPVTPESAPLNAIALMMGPKPLDTDGNSRPDTIQLEAYLFARPYPAPQFRSGTFEFAIYRTGEAGPPDQPAEGAIRTWTLPADQLEGVRSRSLIGACYAISISLLENGGTDAIGTHAVDLTARFFPSDGGAPVSASGVQSLSMSSSALERGR